MKLCSKQMGLTAGEVEILEMKTDRIALTKECDQLLAYDLGDVLYKTQTKFGGIPKGTCALAKRTLKARVDKMIATNSDLVKDCNGNLISPSLAVNFEKARQPTVSCKAKTGVVYNAPVDSGVVDLRKTLATFQGKADTLNGKMFADSLTVGKQPTESPQTQSYIQELFVSQVCNPDNGGNARTDDICECGVKMIGAQSVISLAESLPTSTCESTSLSSQALGNNFSTTASNDGQK